jgi:6-phosphofructokinase 1
VQRGGSPSAFDRFQATILGVAAVDQLEAAPRGSLSVVVGLQGYSVAVKPLMECVVATQAVGKHLLAQQFDLAFQARGSAFGEFWKILVAVSGALQVPRGVQATQAVAVATVGAPAPGMNHCCRAAVRLLMERGHRVLLVHGGFDGMEQNHFEEAHWMSCSGWAGAGGAFLGTGRKTPDEAGAQRIHRTLVGLSVRAVVIIGGYEAYAGALQMNKACGRSVAIAVIPATISKNCVGTEVSIGMDKASNNLMVSCDQIKQSCIGYEKRVFVVESIGRSCGFQSLFGALASGADLVLLPERSPKLQDMDKMVGIMRERFTHTTAQIGLIINSESSSDIFTTSFVRRLHETSLKDIKVSAREALLAGLQQGGDPSPMDRIFSGRMALAAVDHITECLAQPDLVKHEAVACGLVRDERVYTPLSVFERETNHKLRRPLEQPWLEPLLHAFDQVTFPPTSARANSKSNL